MQVDSKCSRNLFFYCTIIFVNIEGTLHMVRMVSGVKILRVKTLIQWWELDRPIYCMATS